MCNGGGLGNLLFGTAAEGASAATSGIIGTAGEFATGNALQAVGSGLAIASQLKQGNDVSGLSKREAALIQKQGDFDLKKSKEEADRTKSRQRVVAAKSGAKSSGSVLEVMRESAELAEQEALNIEMGTDAGVSAKLFEGRQAKKSGNIGAATTALTSFGSFF